MGGKTWNAKDKKALIDGCYIAVKERNLKVPFERGVLVNLALEVMGKWPASSRRFVTTVVQVKWVEEAILEMMTNPVTVTDQTAPTTTGINSSAMPTTIAMVPKETLREKLHSSESVWELIKREVRKTPIIETLVQSIAEQIADDIQAAVTAKLLGRGIVVEEVKPAQEIKPVVPEVKKDEKPERIPVISVPAGKTIIREKKPVEVKPAAVAPIVKKPKIVIMGILGRHMTALQEEYGDRIQIIPLDSDELTKTDICKTADLTLMMRKFISHKHSDRITRQTNKWEYINGGTTEIRDRLNKYLKEMAV